MRAIKQKDTKPELIVRSTLHAMGQRFRLHRADLPGSPDIVLPRHQLAIFVHGCYWHRHNCMLGRPVPTTRREFWQAKFEANVARDLRNLRQLRDLGWHALVVWECQTRDRESLRLLLRSLMASVGVAQAPAKCGEANTK